MIQPSGYSIAGPEFAGAKGHLQEPVPFAGFQYFADSGAALNKEYDARLNPIAPRMVSGVAIGRFKFDERAVAQFGYSVRPEASRKCGADSFAVNGKEVELTGGLSRKLPFPAGEFDFEMSFTCDHSNPDLKIVFLNEEGLPLPSYDAGLSESITDRMPLGAVETTAAAVQVLNQTGFGKSEKEERVELIDFSAPVRLGDFNTTKDQMRKVLAFKFKPKETGLHQIDVRTISNVCRYIFQGGNSCLGRFPYSDPQTGEERQLIGWKLMHPATKITVSDRDNTQYYTQIEASQLYRGVRDNIIGFYVDDRDLQRGLDIRVEIGSSMALALNKSDNILIADAFGVDNPEAHWASISDAEKAEGSQGFVSEMSQAGVAVENSFMLAVREPSAIEFRPLSGSDLANQVSLKRKAVEVIYEVDAGDDTSWLE
ncbi:hypothetical protein ACGYLI_17115 [Sulfitobacter sp. 1A13421]|uniref:hypothetical protein n=1 Tax=Sulfitobacter sp. 1A13421 TaxID=3368595 RepID=UPI0037454D59